MSLPHTFFIGKGALLKFEMTGGVITDVNGYRVHRINSNTTLSVLKSPPGGTIELFMIGGGSAGNSGSSSGPGGAAGGAYLRYDHPAPSAGAYSAVIGIGGVALAGAGVGNSSQRGGNTSVFGIEVEGGGVAGLNTWPLLPRGAGVWPDGSVSFADGGCGGGMYNGTDVASHPFTLATTDCGRSVYSSVGSLTAGSDTPFFFGFAAGSGDSGAGGGGGGIGGPGGQGSSTVGGGNGGAGMMLDWLGSPLYFGGGGGGGNGSVQGGLGGSGVGGNGGVGATAGGNPVANTGSGGGGSGSGVPASGAAGTILIRYLL